ncbi:DMT family transporter [Albidovulum sediminicola]|uniref:DMT family transporter n=1 Tax=Albidovulum sediminicola TaxID=2984331 RepID=A0ABT2Z3H8_9RHOB|nr:DMT family transporter [Defluviimonas sp. WL0075]MCV2865647.1 DMT family transporter [Defluviimonas sp. WL0075]
MTQGAWLPVLLVVCGGMAIAVQAPVNAALGKTLQSPLGAAAVSFGVGFACLTALTLVWGGGGFSRVGGVPAWQLLGGSLGAFYVWAMAASTSALGVVTALAALILGQLGAALLIDHFGAFGLTEQPITLKRIAAVTLVAAGLLLSRS